jgi:hypothetical protein
MQKLTFSGFAAISAARSLHDVDDALNCGVRNLAYQYGKHLSGSSTYASELIFDALELGPFCNQTYVEPNQSETKPGEKYLRKIKTSSTSFYVSPTGNDNNPGTEASPFATPLKALEAARSQPPGTSQIVLRGGTYFLTTALVLGPEDAGLGITSYPGEQPVLSGGVELTNLNWQFVAPSSISGGMTGPFVGISVVSNTPGVNPGSNATGIRYAGLFKDAADSAAACEAAADCFGYTYHDYTVTGGFANMTYFLTNDNEWNPASGYAGHYSGQKVFPVHGSIYSARIPTKINFDNLYDMARNRRLTRAKHPNGNPELTINGFTGGATSWAPPLSYPAPQEVKIPSPSRTEDPFFPAYQLGIGGTCAQFDPPEGFWCTTNPPYGAQYNVPSGVVVPPTLFPGNWSYNGVSDGSQAYFHAFHNYYWGNWIFRVDSANQSTGQIDWSYGGFQEARGASAGSTFMMENVYALLDDYQEWFFNEVTNELFVMFNNTQPPTTSTTLVATKLDSLLRIEGTPDEPVFGVLVDGITFSHTNPTFMKPFTSASGGDWSVRRDGAVYLEGTDEVVLQNCNFTNLGGNAVFIHGWNRGAMVSNSVFRFIGDNAIASLGIVQGMDATSQTYPIGTGILFNVMSELGLYTIQSGAYYHGLSANATVLGNIAFNIPRAAININDGLAGGHIIESNLLFNTVRQSSDHGCINTWDRQPYIWNLANLTNLYPNPTHFSKNFLVSNYRSVWPIDHDDGSNNMFQQKNLFAWGGLKNYLGFNKHMSSNFILYPDTSANVNSVYGLNSTSSMPDCYFTTGSAPFPSNFIDSFTNTTCVVQASGGLYRVDGCNTANPLDGNAPVLANNTLYVDNGQYVFTCQSDTWNLTQAQARGIDIGSNVYSTPDSTALLQLVSNFIATELELA